MLLRLLALALVSTFYCVAADAPSKPLVPPIRGKNTPTEEVKVGAYTDPARTNTDYTLQGEYSGTMRDAPFALQVISNGDGRFDAILCPGGLPGAGWSKQPPNRQRVSGTMEGERDAVTVRFAANGWSGALSGGTIVLQDFKGGKIGTLAHTNRKSPTLGAPPPAGATVLFDGKNTDAFQPGAQIADDGSLMVGCTTKEEFGDCTVHLEFRTPYMPFAHGQARGNSGIYLASQYEVQILDSFGLAGENNECGGIYTIAKPQVNMCLPPLVWQTYDIDYKAASFDGEGKKTADAEISVKHNGVLIHEGVKIPRITNAAPFKKETAKGPIHLQNHGTPVRFQNIWVVKK